jgi:hypothetical protein
MTKKNRSAGELGEVSRDQLTSRNCTLSKWEWRYATKAAGKQGEAAAPLCVTIHTLFLYSPLIIGI